MQLSDCVGKHNIYPGSLRDTIIRKSEDRPVRMRRMRSGRCMSGIAEQALLAMSPVHFLNWHSMEECDIQPPRYGGELLQ